jgi:hypothetical protein
MARRGQYRSRYLNVLGPNGIEQVTSKSDRSASLISYHWHAVSTYLNTGETADLDEYEDKSFSGIQFLTDPEVIDELWRNGELDIESIYASIEGA